MDFLRKDEQSPIGWGKALLLLLVFSYLFINTAWVTEDAFITFRSVNQFLAGNGPVWNPGERVQVYTHPLWYWLIVIGTGLGFESYWLVLALSYVLLLAVLGLLLHLCRRWQLNGYLFLGLMFLLSLSRAFLDYSSSGLENPLLHMLLLAYLAIYFSAAPLAKRFFWTTFIYGLAFLTRPDGVILLTPTSVYLWILMLKQKTPWLKPALLALSPVIAWELFSLLYYGSLVPNTALAKVNIDYPREVLNDNAWKYFALSWDFDPLTLGTIILALLAGFIVGLRRDDSDMDSTLLATGLALQIAYIFRVGADYMLGRFLSASVLLAIVLLALLLKGWRGRLQWRELINSNSPERFGLLLLLVLLGREALRSRNYPSNLDYHNPTITHGIADEHGFYHQRLGMMPVLRKLGGQFAVWGGNFEAEIVTDCFVGMSAWLRPLQQQVIDPLALTEPFLARLPARHNARIGHYERAFPRGFLASRRDGNNQLWAPELGQLYDDVNLVTRSPNLFSGERLAAIWRLNTGHYRDVGRYFDRDDVNLRDLGAADREMREALHNYTLTVCMKSQVVR